MDAKLATRAQMLTGPSPLAPGAQGIFDVSASVTGRAWRPRLDAAGEATAMAIAQRHGLPDVVARVVAGRGIGVDAVEAFLAPSLRAALPDPSTLTDMDRAAVRLADAVEAGEPIGIVADYDVDGASSAAILDRYLAAVGRPPRVHVPDRIAEGYGVSIAAVESLADAGATLLVAVDCGTSSHAALARAAALGLDVVVLDHHPAPTALPPAVALVNPNRQDDLSGLGTLCAAGVTFLAVVALNRDLRRRGRFAGRREPDLLALLDLVALGTVCDVVPLVGLNRAFVARGLAVMRMRANIGLAALADAARLNGPPAAWHLGFLLGPRINAGGRIGDSGLGARLLATDDPAEAARIAADLDTLNRVRQDVEADALVQADAMTIDIGDDPVVVVAGADWHPGVVGLVAARLKERTGRPAIAIASGNGAGSGRSIAGVDLGAAIAAAVEAGILVKGGGHAMAAGVTIEPARVDDLRRFLCARLAGAVAASRAAAGLDVDAALSAAAATPELVEMIEKAGPFGAGCPEPVFAFAGHRIVDALVVGGSHVKVVLAGGDGARLEAISFRSAEAPLGRALIAARGSVRHVAGTLGIDSWGGGRKVVLRLMDLADPAAAPRR
jgi:single-stranded-DNA-specific exonuclease